MFRSFYSKKSFIVNHLSIKSTAAQLAARFSSSNVVVSFKKVSFGYTDVKMLLEDVSFSIREGEDLGGTVLQNEEFGLFVRSLADLAGNGRRFEELCGV